MDMFSRRILGLGLISALTSIALPDAVLLGPASYVLDRIVVGEVGSVIYVID
jgi:hypothetical protein